jgi:hypothetical protein
MPLSLGVASGAGYLKNPAEPFLLGYRVNWVENPSFEVDTTGWSSVASATLSRDTVNYRSGLASLKVVNVSGSAAQYSNLPLVAGSGFYTISAYVKLETAATTANYFIRQLQYENIGGTTVAAGNIGTQNLSVTGDWVRLSGVINKAAAANYLSFRVVTASTTSGDIFYVDDVMVEKGNTAGTYFDGDTGFWAGTAHDSFSGSTPYS